MDENDPLAAATLEWQRDRPELLKRWRAEAVAMIAPYKAMERDIRNYVRQQEAIWWHRKRQEAGVK